MNRKETLIVNLVAGPCSGKSTVAAELFAKLKKMNIKCELVPEFIKEEIYKENQTLPKFQVALFGNEVYSLDNKIGKVDVIIHDGSLLNNVVYDSEKDDVFADFVIYWFKKYNNLSFYIDRGDIEYQDYGRIHSPEQSRDIDNKVQEVHDCANEDLIIVETKTAVNDILAIVLDRLESSKEQYNQEYCIVIPFNHAYQYCDEYIDRKFVYSNFLPDCYIVKIDELDDFRNLNMKDIEYYKIPNDYKTYDDIVEAYRNGVLDYIKLERIQ